MPTRGFANRPRAVLGPRPIGVPGKHADYKREVIDKQVALMQKRGIWKKPAHSPG